MAKNKNKKPASKPVSQKPVSTANKTKGEGSKKATVVKNSAVASFKTATEKAKAEKAEAESEIVSISQPEIHQTIEKGWSKKGADWTKKFDLGTEDPKTVLIAKIVYGKVSLNDL